MGWCLSRSFLLFIITSLFDTFKLWNTLFFVIAYFRNIVTISHFTMKSFTFSLFLLVLHNFFFVNTFPFRPRLCTYIPIYPSNRKEIYGSSRLFISVDVYSSVEHSVKRSMQIVRYTIKNVFIVPMIGFLHFTRWSSPSWRMVKMKMMHACMHTVIRV